MRRIVVMLSVSLDGFFEGPDHDLSWHAVDEEVHTHFNAELGAMSAFLSGRRTWQLMADFWPTADEDPDAPAPIAEFARIWRDTPKIVYSRTLAEAGWNTTIEREVDPDAIRRMKDLPGGDMAVGGADLAAAFRRLGLIDEYRLCIVPIAIGTGTPLFPPSEGHVPLTLLGTRTFGNGAIEARYAPAPTGTP